MSRKTGKVFLSYARSDRDPAKRLAVNFVRRALKFGTRTRKFSRGLTGQSI